MNLAQRWPILRAWKFFLAVLVPVILLVIPIIWRTKTSYAAYSVIIMAFYWMFELIPISVTALLPIIFYPLFGIQDSGSLAQQYLKDSVQIFVGGIMVALAFEYCNLHKRIALRVMLATGTSIGMLLLGIMLTTTVLSMWMFNTATTAMMVPIIKSIVDELEKGILDVYNKEQERKPSQESVAKLHDKPKQVIEIDNPAFVWEPEVPVGNAGCVEFETVGSMAQGASSAANKSNSRKKVDKVLTNLRTMLLLATCYSSNIGGTGVITGSGTNLVAIEFLGNLDPAHHGKYASLTFATWMGFNVIPMFINMFVAWIYLQIVYLGLPNKFKFWKSKDERLKSNSIFTIELENKIKTMLTDSYASLGSLTCHEIGVMVCFFLVVATWLLHDPKIIPGWSSLFEKKISISSSGLLFSVLFFIIPQNKEFYTAIKKLDFRNVKVKPLLDYKFAFQKFPWSVLLLLGGGYALSAGAKESGLSAAIGESLSSLSSLKPSIIQIVCMFLIGFLTEVTSNTATASIVVPILLELSRELNIHPFYLTLPATITCSYAFMLPVATPPNAIVYAASDMKVSDMIKTGFFMNCACIIVLFISTNLYGNIFFNFNDYTYVP